MKLGRSFQFQNEVTKIAELVNYMTKAIMIKNNDLFLKHVKSYNID